MHQLSHFMTLALQSLKKNTVQAGLAIVGVTVGVTALVTSLALGRGAQVAIEDQLLSAGVNMIIVTAGNYQVQGGSGGGSTEADHGNLFDPRQSPEAGRYAARSPGLRNQAYPVRGMRAVADASASIGPALWSASEPFEITLAHYEDDPDAVHDHPTASERLGDSMAGLGAAATLTVEDARAIESQIAGVQFTASGVHENARVVVAGSQRHEWLTRLHGTEADLPQIRSGWFYPYGGFLTDRHVEEALQVMVLGRVVAERLFGADTNPVGKTVSLWNQPFEIVGVVDSRSWASRPSAGDDQFDAVYVPVSTVHRLLNLSKLNTITVTSGNSGETTRIAGEIVDLLRQRHGITDMMPDDFTVRTQAEQVLGKGLPPALARVVSGNMTSVDDLTIGKLSASLERANRTMSYLLAGIAAVSLVVGGIGVMNLLLLSVTQRTREVGLRIAMGARRRDIASQFLLEAVSLTLIGGVSGALLGVFVSSGVERLFQWSTDVSIVSTLLAVAVAIVLGVLSGVYPARRASRLDPIGALHFE